MDIQSKLNPKQYEAASSMSQYLRIIAGAGTGKTRTLSYRIAYLIDQGMVPNRICAITFTNKAAKEMLTRVTNILDTESDVSYHTKPLISTFHGFCYRFLKKEIQHVSPFNGQFNILDDGDQNSIFKDIFKGMPKGDSKEYVQAVVGKIRSLKSDGVFVNDVSPADVPIDAIYTFDELIFVYKSYQMAMLRQNCLDFDDLLMFTGMILRQNPDVQKVWRQKYDIFLIDEFQDTNLLQYDLVKLFMRHPGTLGPDDEGTRLTVVGDPDQTIYTWRGAKNELIKTRLGKDFPTLQTVVLDDNYRSTQSILDCANKVIVNNHDRIAKDLHAASGDKGSPVVYTNYSNSDSEGYAIASQIHQMVSRGVADYDQIAIIYRANYLSNAIEKQLTSFKIPYQVYGGLKFFERAEIKDALSYLRILIAPDDFSFQRILQAPSKGIGEATIAKAKLIQQQNGNSLPLMEIFRHHLDGSVRIKANSRLALDRFFQAYDTMLALYRSKPDNATLLSGIRTYFIDTGFTDYVMKEDKKAEEKLAFTASSSTSRVDNVNEFMRSLTQAMDSPMLDEDGNAQDSTLEDFLISVALQSDQDTMADSKQVALMTGHVSKGLEFPIVFVTGMNQSIFPSMHAMMKEDRSSIEEERRLFYVCMTRAQKRLFISSFGGVNFRTGGSYTPSMFIKETGLINRDTGDGRPAISNNYYASLGMHRPTAANRPVFSARNIQSLQGHPASQDPAQQERWAVGDGVVHTSFGKGKVTAIEGQNLVVSFPEPYGVKRLRIGFKAFRKLKEGE